MATVSRSDALWALKKADWFQLSWGRRPSDGGPDQFCAAGYMMLRQYGPDWFGARGDLLFPKEDYLETAMDVLTQVANWAEILGFIRRTHFGETITDVYIFDQERVSREARG